MTGALDRVELAVAAGTMGIREALSLIAGRGGGLVVTEETGPASVLSAEDLLRALRSGDEGPLSTIQLLRTRGETPEPTDEVTITPARGPGPLVAGETAVVEGLAPARAVRLISAVTLYVCTHDDTHVFMADELFHRDKCNLDGYPVKPL
jgi:hypothetical protein